MWRRFDRQKVGPKVVIVTLWAATWFTKHIVVLVYCSTFVIGGGEEDLRLPGRLDTGTPDPRRSSHPGGMRRVSKCNMSTENNQTNDFRSQVGNSSTSGFGPAECAESVGGDMGRSLDQIKENTLLASGLQTKVRSKPHAEAIANIDLCARPAWPHGQLYFRNQDDDVQRSNSKY